ncbi:hypothetical protein [Desulforhopalus sp. IMCC35007]|uniref:hypothetical protein n=1 Tax=Desulforhopalus sp. IMCC35007 TaxID=2569543 RepID=UPI0010ADF6CD|nr:hypothetical protein [Desulforhopalus sp. IMCC35007]TKB07443.1 hypothetical protein FCL48_17025 [Desulforhopalus sp. IMCC35007]
MEKSKEKAALSSASDLKRTAPQPHLNINPSPNGHQVQSSIARQVKTLLFKTEENSHRRVGRYILTKSPQLSLFGNRPSRQVAKELEK